jgi:hypothetical protein
LRSRRSRTRLYSPPSNLVEHDGEELRDLPFLDRKAALRNTEAGTLFNEHLAEDGQTVFASACGPGVEGIVSKRVDGTYRSGRCPAWIKVRNPARIAGQRERRENWNRDGGWLLALAILALLEQRRCGQRWLAA